VTEADWLACDDPAPMLKHLDRVTNARKFALYACGSCRAVYDRLTDPRSREAVEAAERAADRLITESDLRRAAERAAEVRSSHPVRAVYRAANDPPDYVSCLWVTGHVSLTFGECDSAEWIATRPRQAALLRCVFGNPFRPTTLDRSLLTPTALSLADATYAERSLPSGELDLSRLRVLSDALEEAGCTDAEILSHLRSPGPHVCGCWAVDLILGKE
jgi:hypothetical protein